MKLVIFAVLVVGAYAADPEKEAPAAKGKKGDLDKETAQKFEDLGKDTRNITSRWKRYPHRQNRSNETSAALRGDFRRVMDSNNTSLCGRKIPMKFRHLWKVKKQTEEDILGSPQQRNFNVWSATRGIYQSTPTSTLQKKAGLRGVHAVMQPGSDQTLASGGATGKVAGTEVGSTVLKDGFWEVGCYTDKMVTSADKFGDEKDKYKDVAGVSIANYADLIDDADKMPMTPTVCFEFCSTIPDMVFFGITEGRSCYCTPYFSPGPGDGSKCDAVCEGDTTLMCGSTSGRSSVFEMHVCEE